MQPDIRSFNQHNRRRSPVAPSSTPQNIIADEVVTPPRDAALEAKALSGDRCALTQLMVNFISAQPQSMLRIDHFAREHSFGRTGFYSHFLDFAHHGAERVFTPLVHDQGYRAGLSQLIAEFIGQKLRHPGNLTVAEIGGGNGAMKREILAAFGSIPELAERLTYISIDINPKQVAIQAAIGARAQLGSATDTGLPDQSIDLLFDEEVLDCLPPRVFKINRRSSQVESEAYVNSQLSLTWKPFASDDRDAALVNRVLQSRRSLDGQSFIEFAPDQRKYWQESFRILKPDGIRFSSDYGELMTLSGAEVRGSSARYVGMHGALSHPYTVDLTHGVDFDAQEILAHEAGFRNVRVDDLLQRVHAMSALGRKCIICRK